MMTPVGERFGRFARDMKPETAASASGGHIWSKKNRSAANPTSVPRMGYT